MDILKGKIFKLCNVLQKKIPWNVFHLTLATWFPSPKSTILSVSRVLFKKCFNYSNSVIYLFSYLKKHLLNAYYEQVFTSKQRGFLKIILLLSGFHSSWGDKNTFKSVKNINNDMTKKKSRKDGYKILMWE